MGLLPEQYYRMSQYDFNLLCDGKIKAKKDFHKAQMILTRQTCWTIYRGWVDPKKGAQTIEEYWPLNDSKEKSKKELAAQARRIKATLAKIKEREQNG